MNKGQPSLLLEAIATAQQAIAADPALLCAHWVLAWSHNWSHLWRWGPEPEKALDAAWSAVERMLSIDALDYRTLTQCGVTRLMRGEQERGIADLRRALDVNPNSAITLVLLSWAEATAGLGEEAKAHAPLALRLRFACARATCISEAPSLRWRWRALRRANTPKRRTGPNWRSNRSRRRQSAEP